MNKAKSFYTAPGLEPPVITLQKFIADTFGVSPEVLELPFSKNRKREIINARYAFMYYVSELSNNSNPNKKRKAQGKIKGKGPTLTAKQVGRGHCDVLYAVKIYNNLCDTDKNYRSKAEAILKAIDAQRVIIPEFCQS